MKFGILALVAIVALGGFAVLAATGNDNSNSELVTVKSASKMADEETAMSKNIVETAVEAGNFTTLITAVKAAGLAETLSGEGPFTVFAPTDEAFSQVSQETLDRLLSDKDLLTNVLLYHVASGNLSSDNVLAHSTINSLEGQALPISLDPEPSIAGAVISATDIETSNGVIHVIDSVLVPESVSKQLTKGENNMKNIVDTAIEAGNFKTLVTAVQTAGLVDTLSGEGPFTVFAPTDEAFEKLGTDTIKSLLEDKEKLAGILTYHVVAGKVMAEDVTKLTSAKTVQGSEVSISTDNGVMVNESNVVKTDIETSNGVIHVIDNVLIPTN